MLSQTLNCQNSFFVTSQTLSTQIVYVQKGDVMCSSPKSSGNRRPKIQSTRGLIGSLSSDAISRYADCANAAYERRQLRKQKKKA